MARTRHVQVVIVTGRLLNACAMGETSFESRIAYKFL